VSNQLFRIENKWMDIEQIVAKFCEDRGIEAEDETVFYEDALPHGVELPDSLGG
jgi:hypothetical protein